MTKTAEKNCVRELVPLLRVRKMQRAVDFYCGQLGFRITSSWEPGGRLEWCRLERNGAALMLQKSCDEDGPAAQWGSGIEFFFNCDDAGAVHREFVHRGLDVAPPERAFYGMDQIFVRDPDGYRLCFQSEHG